MLSSCRMHLFGTHTAHAYRYNMCVCLTSGRNGRSLQGSSDVVVKAVQTGFAPSHGGSSVNFPLCHRPAVRRPDFRVTPP